MWPPEPRLALPPPGRAGAGGAVTLPPVALLGRCGDRIELTEWVRAEAAEPAGALQTPTAHAPGSPRRRRPSWAGNLHSRPEEGLSLCRAVRGHEDWNAAGP